MSKATHTIAPWSIWYGGMDNDTHFTIGPRVGPGVICEYAYASILPRPWQEVQANARLIAAAPELLAACKDALATGGQDMQHILDNGRLRDVLRAAIALAEGSDK